MNATYYYDETQRKPWTARYRNSIARYRTEAELLRAWPEAQKVER